MRIIGIDPGTIVTGIGVIECTCGNISVISYDTLNCNAKEPMHERLKKIYDSCMQKIMLYKPQEFAIETAFYGKNVQSTMKLGQARGAAIVAAANSFVNIAEYSPREIKKSVTGNGASSKEQVRFMVMKILGIKENPEFIDSTDALAIALCHYYNSLNSPSLNGSFKKGSKKKNNWSQFIKDFPEKIITVN